MLEMINTGLATCDVANGDIYKYGYNMTPQ